MIKPEKNKKYLVKIINEKHPHYGAEVKVKFTGIVMRSLVTQNFLYENEYEIVEELKDKKQPEEEKGLFDDEPN